MADNILQTSKQVKPKFSFSGIDTRNIDPDRLPLGTEQQDCSLIAQMFERGAHSIPSEAAVFATITRNIQNNKNFAVVAKNNLQTYLQAPQDAANKSAEQATRFASDITSDLNTGGGTVSPNEHIMQAFNIGTQKQAANTESFGEKLLDWARDCIPCDVRLMAFLELHPNVDLLGVLEGYLQNALVQLSDVTDLLNNFDIYGDFCDLLDLLSFMCIPDLQRIVALLMALFTLQVPQLDGMIGMLQALVQPIFAPILMSISSLLDQFTALVTNPLDCVVDAINAQLKKLSLETGSASFQIESMHSNEVSQLSTGLKQLNVQLQEGIQEINNKLNFYVSQIKALIGEMGGGDAAYLQAKLKILQLTRMLSFVTAIITALSKGHAACSSSKSPERQELDSFFDNFLNPNSAFNLWIDQEGQIHIDEKIEGFDTAVDPPHLAEPLPEFGNMFKFEGEPLLETVELQIQEIATQLAHPTRAIIPCKLETSVADANKVNQWIEQLNQT